MFAEKKTKTRWLYNGKGFFWLLGQDPDENLQENPDPDLTQIPGSGSATLAKGFIYSRFET